MKSTWSLAVVLLLALTGCPDTGIVCRMGTDRCGTGCADYSSDRRNCGACGASCAQGQVCSSGACECQDGTRCDGQCVVTASDPRHCGACGTVCAAGQVCEKSQCKASCTAGISLLCGEAACVDATRDNGNCGACGQSCQGGQQCSGGVCLSDVVVACFSSGQVAGLSSSSLQRAPLADLGTAPAALATVGGVLLAADGLDRKLNQADLPSGATSFRELPQRSISTGAVPNQVLVDGELVFVVNAESGTLQVVRRGQSDGDAGLALSTVAELPLGSNTFPQGLAKVGASLWLPLYGGFGAASAAAGQRLVEVNVQTPTAPAVVNEVSLKGLDLRPFDPDAGSTPRPWAITQRGGQLYVVLNNLDADTYAPAGPGLLAKVDPVTRAVSVVTLGPDCLNPQWAAPVASGLVVSCGGKSSYSGQSFVLVGSEKAGVVVLDLADRVVGQWAPAAPSCGDAGSCPLFLPGRFSVKGSRVFLADQNAGRLAVLELVDGGVVERRGPAANDGLAVCPVSATSGVANVSDVFSP
jgi:hypothetical protein